MRRGIVALVVLLIGIAIGSCIATARPREVTTRQDWRPVVGVRYERPGARARTVTVLRPEGVTYRWDDGRERYCTAGTWRRWCEAKGRE